MTDESRVMGWGDHLGGLRCAFNSDYLCDHDTADATKLGECGGGIVCSDDQDQNELSRSLNSVMRWMYCPTSRNGGGKKKSEI